MKTLTAEEMLTLLKAASTISRSTFEAHGTSAGLPITDTIVVTNG
jgi:hypothetical protein